MKLVTTECDCTHRNKSSIHNCKCKNTHLHASSPLIYLVLHTLALNSSSANSFCSFLSNLQVDAPTTKCCSGPPFQYNKSHRATKPVCLILQCCFYLQHLNVKKQMNNKCRGCKRQLSSDDSLQGPIKAPSIKAITPCEAVGMLRVKSSVFLNYHADIKL